MEKKEPSLKQYLSALTHILEKGKDREEGKENEEEKEKGEEDIEENLEEDLTLLQNTKLMLVQNLKNL